MGEDAGAGPVGGLTCVRERLTLGEQRLDELVGEVRVGAAVAAALREGQVVFAFAVDALGREVLDLLREAMGEVGYLDLLRDLWLGLLRRVEDRLFAFDERPLERLLRAVDVDGFAVLAGRVEERADDARRDVGLMELDMGRLDREGRVVDRDHVLGDAAGAEARDIFRVGAGEGEHRADAVRGVVHRREAGPVAGPAFHILLVRGLEELQAAELAVVVELLHVEELAGVDHRLHHHVAQARGLHQLHDLFAFGDRGRHRDRAGHVLAGLEGGDGLATVVGDRRVDVDRVDFRVLEQRVEVRVALRDLVAVADRLQLLRVALADRDDLRVRVGLVDWDEFGAEAEAGQRDANLRSAHGGVASFSPIRRKTEADFLG